MLPFLSVLEKTVDFPVVSSDEDREFREPSTDFRELRDDVLRPWVGFGRSADKSPRLRRSVPEVVGCGFGVIPVRRVFVSGQESRARRASQSVEGRDDP
jgi:hypothetical protein